MADLGLRGLILLGEGPFGLIWADVGWIGLKSALSTQISPPRQANLSQISPLPPNHPTLSQICLLSYKILCNSPVSLKVRELS